jgi:hypothetical protein
MQLLLKNAQSELQKQTFRDILTDLKTISFSQSRKHSGRKARKSLREKSNFQPKGAVKNY